MKGLLMVGANQYGVLSAFIDGIRHSLQQLGVQADLLDIGSQSSINQHLADGTDPDDYDFFFNFNAVGLDLSLNGKPLAQVIPRKPFFVFLVDHPLHQLGRLLGHRVILLCVDQEHVSFARLCGFQAHFFPHAVPAEQIAQAHSLKPLQERTQVLFPVSYFDTAHWRQKLQPVWHQVGHLLDTCPSVTRFLQQLGVLPLGDRPATVGLDNNIQRLAVCADYYIRGRQRAAVLARCQQLELPLTVVGNGSRQYAPAYPLHQYLDAVPFAELLVMMQNARFVLHNSPGFELGLHERVVYPLALGTPVLCDALAQPQRILGAGYQRLGLEQLPALTAEQYRALQLDNLDIIRNRHTWQWQLQTLLAEYQLWPQAAAPADAAQC